MSKVSLIQDLKIALIDDFSVSDLDNIGNQLAVLLDKYEVTQKCYDLIPYTAYNEKIITKWLCCMKLDGKANSTIKAYSREINKFVEYLNNKQLINVSEDDIKGYLANKLIRGLSKVSVNASRNYISSFYNWMVNEHEIAENPCATQKQIKCDKVIKVPFTDVELDLLRHNDLCVRDKAIIEFLLSSGVRVNELCELNIEDVDLQSHRVHVRKGKGAKDRITFISSVASHYLQKYLQSRDDNNSALFISNDNKNTKNRHRLSTDGTRYILTRIGNKVGVTEIYPHKFRRTFATTLYNKGMDIHEIQRLLGHTSISVTMTYIVSNDFGLESSYKKYTI